MKLILLALLFTLTMTVTISAARGQQNAEASRNRTRELLRTLLDKSGPEIKVSFRQSERQPFNFVGVMKDGLVNSDGDNEIYRHSEAGIQFELPKGLERQLGSRFREGEKIDCLPNAPNVIIATPAQAAANLIKPTTQPLAEKLRSVHTVIHRWPAAFLQYSVDLPKVWQKARDSWCLIPGRMLFGNYTGQISLRGMIESAASLW